MLVNHLTKKKAGFTLIETIIYIALFSFLIFGGFVAAFELIQGTDTLNAKTVRESEINFVLRKINWALTGIDPSQIILPSGVGSILTVTKYDGNTITIRLQNGKIEMRESNGVNIFLPITTDNVAVSSLEFTYIAEAGQMPPGMKAELTLEGETRNTTKYIRK